MTTTFELTPEMQRQSKAARRKRKVKDILDQVATHTGLITLAVMFIFPLFLVFVVSVMTPDQASNRELWPNPFVWGNYVEVFNAVPFMRWTMNTFLIAAIGAIGVVISCVPPAYVLSHLQWKGRQATFILILSTMMLPGQVTMIPVYIIFHNLGWIPSYLPLTVPAFFGGAFSIFLLRQFFVSIPIEITDAARIDGCSEFKLLLRIIIPLAKPAIAAVALFAFLGAWNDFFGPLLYLDSDSSAKDTWTLGIGLNSIGRELHHVNRALMMAASALFMAPVITLFFFAQKVFIEGVTLTGVKG
jgi:multiple sugar transport system permease protein